MNTEYAYVPDDTGTQKSIYQIKAKSSYDAGFCGQTLTQITDENETQTQILYLILQQQALI